MSILKRCAELREKTNSYQAREAAHLQSESLRKQESELASLYTRLEGALGRHEVLRKHGREPAPPNSTATALETIRKLQRSVAGAQEAGSLVKQSKKVIDKLIADLDKTAEAALPSEQLPSEATLRTWAKLSGKSALVDEIRALLPLIVKRKFQEFSPSELDAQLERRLRVSKLSSDLQIENWPLHVREFLTAAGNPEGASITALSEDIRKWLQDNEQAHRVCVRLR